MSKKVIRLIKADTMIPFGPTCEGGKTAHSSQAACPFLRQSEGGRDCWYVQPNAAGRHALRRNEKICNIRVDED